MYAFEFYKNGASCNNYRIIHYLSTINVIPSASIIPEELLIDTASNTRYSISN